MTPTQARLAAERKARLDRINQASLQHFDRCYQEAQELLPKPAPQPEPKPLPKPINIESLPAPLQTRHRVLAIQETVCARFGIQWSDLISPCRKPVYAKPRQIAMYLAREITKMSFPQIGHRFGGKDHTSVIHAHRQVAKRIETDPAIAADVQALREELSA